MSLSIETTTVVVTEERLVEEIAASWVSQLLRAGMIDEARNVFITWCKRVRLEKLYARITRLHSAKKI